MPAKYKRYAQLPEFLRSFHRSCIERGENESVYDAFLGFSEERCRDVPRGELLAAARKARIVAVEKIIFANKRIVSSYSVTGVPRRVHPRTSLI